MFGVIWGHMILHLLVGMDVTVSIHSLFRCYDMPFFMVISGYFLSNSCNKYNLLQLLLNKTTMIIIPSIVWSLIYSRLHDIDCFYFLTAVYVSSVFIIIIHKLFVGYKYLKLGFLLTPCAFLYCINHPLWNLSYLYPFFLLGYWGYFVKRPKHWIPVILLFITLFCFWSPSYNIWNSGSYLIGNPQLLGVIIFRMVIAVFGILSALIIFDYLYPRFQMGGGRIYELIIRAGRQTLMLYILQCFPLRLMENLMYRVISISGFNPLCKIQEFFAYVLAPILSLLMLWILTIIIECMNKNKYLHYLNGFRINLR